MPERDPSARAGSMVPALATSIPRSETPLCLPPGLQMGRILDDAARSRRLILVVDVPALLSRLSLYQALDDQIGRWGRRQDDISAFIDLSNHPVLPAQTVIGSMVQTWVDMADGLPEALSAASILIVHGLEQMLQDTPHRLTAFLEARARHQVVVVVTPQASLVCQLAIRNTRVHLEGGLTSESDQAMLARSIAHAAISAARQATRRTELRGDASRRSSAPPDDAGGAT